MSGDEPIAIVVVDDDVDVRGALLDTLELEGYPTRAFASAVEALSFVRRIEPPPRLILLDWNMAPMSGPEFMAEIAKEPELAAVPVVLLTADIHVERKRATGRYADHLSKPVKLDALFALVRRYAGEVVAS
jgi:CheY-like chemotaxis protein